MINPSPHPHTKLLTGNWIFWLMVSLNTTAVVMVAVVLSDSG
jgi:hypothetical protein